jgi:sugar phosphate isomerase/epimerase
VHPLVPYAGHFHLRQGANRRLQARWEDGEINLAEVVGRFQEAGYEGYLHGSSRMANERHLADGLG